MLVADFKKLCRFLSDTTSYVQYNTSHLKILMPLILDWHISQPGMTVVTCD